MLLPSKEQLAGSSSSYNHLQLQNVNPFLSFTEQSNIFVQQKYLSLYKHFCKLVRQFSTISPILVPANSQEVPAFNWKYRGFTTLLNTFVRLFNQDLWNMPVLTRPLATHEEKCSLVSPSCFRAKVCSDSHPTKTARVQTKHKFIFSILQQLCIAGDMQLYTNIHLLLLSRR